MADSITKCVEIFDAQGNLEVRIVHYRLEYAGRELETAVDVHVREMSDPTDLNECRTLANTKIATPRSRWIDSLANPASAEEEISDINGSL